MTIGWPAALMIMFFAFWAMVLLTNPARQRHEIKMAEVKGKSNEHYKVLTEKFEQLAEETRGAQAAMQTDLSAVRSSVESIEQMMRDVG